MPSSTPQYGLPYLELTDPPDIPKQGQDLAEATESTIAPIDTRLTTAEADIVAHDGRLDTLEADTAYGAWQDMVLQNGWVARAGFQGPRYRKIPGNSVEFAGTIVGGNTATNTLLFTLPVGYRPDFDCAAPLMLNSGQMAGISVKSTGAVTLFVWVNAAGWGAATFTGSVPLTTANA